jgi:uncharacterized protein
MTTPPAFHRVPLARHPEVEALIRDSDRRVLLCRGPARGEDPGSLFAQHQDVLEERQPTWSGRASKRTLTLYMVLTDRCNLGCRYCDVLGRPDQRQAGCVMSWETASRAMEILLARLRAEPELEAQVTFFGGEPLLAWPLLERLCRHLEDQPERRRISRMLVTNGTLLDDAKSAFLLEHRVYVVVSLDGRPEVHDGVRGLRGGGASFPAVDRGMASLNRVMPGRWGISCTVGSHNAASLNGELIWMQERYDPLCIGLNIYHYQRDGGCGIAMDDDAMGEAMLEAFRLARREGISIYQYIGILKGFLRRERNLDYCPACVDKLLFSPAGRVGRCETLMFDERFSVPLDQVRDHDLPAHLDWSAYTPEHEPACQACPARWICPGSCAYDQWVSTGELHGVQGRRCAFHQGMLVELLDLLLEAAQGERGAAPLLVPAQRHFEAVPGVMPTSFPADTIWIVSMAAASNEPAHPGATP